MQMPRVVQDTQALKLYKKEKSYSAFQDKVGDLKAPQTPNVKLLLFFSLTDKLTR